MRGYNGRFSVFRVLQCVWRGHVWHFLGYVPWPQRKQDVCGRCGKIVDRPR